MNIAMRRVLRLRIQIQSRVPQRCFIFKQIQPQEGYFIYEYEYSQEYLEGTLSTDEYNLQKGTSSLDEYTQEFFKGTSSPNEYSYGKDASFMNMNIARSTSEVLYLRTNITSRRMLHLKTNTAKSFLEKLCLWINIASRRALYLGT